MRSIRFQLLLFCISILATSLVRAQTFFSDITTLEFSPTLTLAVALSDYTASLPTTAPDAWRDYRGIIVEEIKREELYPLLRTIFYDAGEVEPPNRYKKFRLPQHANLFSPEMIPGGTLQKYYYLLNIVGFRMKEHPETKIRLVCEYTGEGKEIEELADKRGAFVRNYLRDIWQIRPERVEGITSLQSPAQPDDTVLGAELRSVNIESDNWEICSPLYIKEVRRFYSPDTIRMQVDPLIPLADVSHCYVEFFKNGQLWFRQEVTEKANDSLLVGSLNWIEMAEETSLSDDLLVAGDSFRAVAIVVDRSGKRTCTATVPVPMKFIDRSRSYTSCLMNARIINRFSLPLFSRNSSSVDTAQGQILANYYPFFSGASGIKITGYADTWENDSSLVLSRRRAEQVLNYFRKTVLFSSITNIVDEGVGSTQPLYSNDLPEGRYYNRTVQIVIESPRDNREPWE